MRRHYHLPAEISVPEGVSAQDRQRLNAVVVTAIDRAVHAAVPGETPAPPAGTRPEPRERVTPRAGGRSYAIPSYGGNDAKVGIPVAGTPQQVESAPTYGNLPREEHDPIQRVILRQIGGKWREVSFRGRRTASGDYDFVI